MSAQNLETEEIDELLKKMRDPQTGVPIKDRSWLLKTYKSCFVGKELVDWMIKTQIVKSRKDGVELGNLLLGHRCFLHVTGDHLFKDEEKFYRFEEDQTKVNRGASAEDAKTWAKFIPYQTDSESEENLLGSSNSADTPRVLSQQPRFNRGVIEEMNSQDQQVALEVTPHDKWNIQLLDNVHPPKWQNPTPSGTYNLVVIGAGSGGLVSAAGSAGLGARVAIIEKHLMGGDCLNVGCVPSKALIRAAHSVAEVRDSAEYGVKLTNGYQVDFGAVMERLRRLRASIAPHDSAARYANELGIDVFIGEARFVNKDTVVVGDTKLKFSRCIIASGGRAGIPKVPGLEDMNVLTNANIFNLTELPKKFIVVGVGAIGCEMAQCFARFGSEVHLIARGSQLLGREDPEAASVVAESLKKDGVHVHFHTTLKRAFKDEKGKHLEVECKGQSQTLEFNEILVSTGRLPNVEGMDLEKAGVKYSPRGIEVTDALQTTNSNIYAVGDVCTEYKFTHMSDFMARIAIRNTLFFGNAKVSSLIIPWATYTYPEVAHVGLYEADLKERKIAYDVYTKYFKEVDRAILESETEGFVRVLCKEGTDKILGATIVDTNAGDMISEITVAMQNNIGLGTIATVIHPYPTRAEAVRQIGDMYNRTRLTPTVKILFRKLLAVRR